jgi:hypothetical protein
MRKRHPTATLASAVVAVVLLSNAVTSAQTTVAPITFSTASDYTSNFRQTIAEGNLSSGVDSGVYRVLSNSTQSSSVLSLYDTTPGDGTATRNTFLNETVRSDFRIVGAGGSFGLLVRVSSTDATSYLGLINIDSSSTNDQIRLFDSTPANSMTVSSTLHNSTTSSSVLSLNTWYTLSLTAANNATSGVDLTLQVFAQGTDTNPLLSAVVTDTSSPLLSAGQIGVRMYSTAGSGRSTATDNFTVVPEPASLGLLAILPPVLLPRRRRRVR